MKQLPITHLVIDTSSSNEYDSGDCDYCLVQMTSEYVSYVLGYMDEVRRLRQADSMAYSLKCWDAGPRYFRFTDKLRELRDIDGDLAVDVPAGEPILLTADPQIADEDLARVECKTVGFTKDEVWWTAYVKHTGIRIETARVQKKTLLRIQRSLGGAPAPKPAGAKNVQPKKGR
jgi:hypothetical protein